MKSFGMLLFFLVLRLAWTIYGLTCSQIKHYGSGSKFALEALKTLEDGAFKSCLVYLGKDPLNYVEGRYLWKRLIKIYGNEISNIPDEDLQQLGWIMKAIPPKDIKNLTLTDIDTISAFGQYHNLSEPQALAERVREDWSAKEPTDYTFYDLMALNHILCGFNTTDIGMIHPDSYKEAAPVLAMLRDCPKEPLEAIASLALSSAAFDAPFNWHSSQVKAIGCVLNGMSSEDISSIPPIGMESLTPEVMPCLLKQTLRSMTAAQLSHLTPSAAAAVSHIQKSSLTYEQQQAITKAYSGNSDLKNCNKALHEIQHFKLVTFFIVVFKPLFHYLTNI